MRVQAEIKIRDLLPHLDYSAEAVMAKRQICYTAVLSLLQPESLTVGFAPEGVDPSIDRLPAEQRQEISDHLYSYTETLLLCEIEGRIWAIVPSFYPSSTLFAALIFDDEQFSVAEILRLARCDGTKDMFAFSKYISTPEARMSERLGAKAERFFELCREIMATFFNINKMPGMVGEEKCRDELMAQILRISRFLGVPLLSICEDQTGERKYSQTDYPLFTAYMLSFMLLAKNIAPGRALSVSLSSLAGAAMVRLAIDAEESLGMSPAILTWENITDDKSMIFEYIHSEKALTVGFNPMRFDWSRLGLKQKNEFHKLK